jgi:hypothetical protein
MRGTVNDSRYDRDVDRTRRRAFLFAVATTAIACGIEVRGLVVPGDGIDSGVDPDAALDSNPANDANASDADADAPFDCGDGGGGFCDLCDETLLLCVPFEDEAKDQSRYNHAVIVLGQLGFVNGPAGHGRAMEIDAATTLRVAHNKAWEDHNALTIEMFIRINALPPDGGRAGLVDKNSAFGFFLQPNGDLACSVGPNLRGQPDGGLDGGRYTHVACVSGGGRSVLYARGVQLVEADSGSPSPSNEELAIAGNSPAGDPFIGSIDGLRIYKRAKTAKEIANDSLVFVTIDGGDAAVQQ